jgi:hypothetical protein
MRPERDSERSRRLLFAPELADGTVRPADLARSEVRDATLSRRVPAGLTRAYQRRLMRRGGLGFEEATVSRAMAARRAVLGERAEGPPRLLVRVDTFPHPLAWDEPERRGTEAFRRARAILAEAGLPYLLSVRPRVARRPLDPRESADRQLTDDELEELADLRRDGVAFAAHGLDHRTRHRSPRRRSELGGLSKGALTERLDRIEAELAEAAIRPEVFAAPFDRFDWRQWEALAARYDVVSGGDPSVARVGYHDTPLWRGDAVWAPAYPPFYGSAADALAGARRLADAGAGVWVPVVLHWDREADAGWRDLERFAREAARWAVDWETFLAAVRASRGAPG